MAAERPARIGRRSGRGPFVAPDWRGAGDGLVTGLGQPRGVAAPMRIHFTGIAGAGMSAAALMLRDAGHEVSGSDAEAFPPMSTYVEGLGFPFHRSFDAANLPADLDVLVLGASAKLGGADNPEVAEARRRGVTVTTFPE